MSLLAFDMEEVKKDNIDNVIQFLGYQLSHYVTLITSLCHPPNI